MPEKKTERPINNEIVHMLYNKYLLMLRELDAYKNKIVYFLNTDETDPEYKLETMNLDFDNRIIDLTDKYKGLDSLSKELKNRMGKAEKELDQLGQDTVVMQDVQADQGDRIAELEQIMINSDRIIKTASLYTD